jgi:2,3,4,5-tetrahydropyridine-2,6-dicarboxylate N-succinyltransferase
VPSRSSSSGGRRAPLRERVEALLERAPARLGRADRALFGEFRAALGRGEVRAAEPVAGGWRVNAWVKRAILFGFRAGALVAVPEGPKRPAARFFDKDTFPLKPLTLADEVRLVPGGSAIRDGAYVAKGVVCMPPMFVNVGAYVDEGTMIDSHALVGSCAQVGKRVHLSAAAQIGGVLEPVGALPVVVEDDVLVGGGCGVYEGTIVRRGAVLAAGTILTGSTPVYDLVRGGTYRKTGAAPLEIPAGAVVVPGSRPAGGARAAALGVSVYAPVIVKYRDGKTTAATALEEALR